MKRALLRLLAVAVAAVAFVAAAFILYVEFAWSRPVARSVVDLTAPRGAEDVRRGQHLFDDSLLCWTCHGSEGSLGPQEPQAGGRVFDMTNIGPGFGVAYGTNLTADVETGLGAWSYGEIVRAIREGVGRDGHVIFPVMAYQFYHGLSDDDALALVAYLRSLPPVHNQVPPRRLSFVARALIAIAFTKPESAIAEPVRAPAQGPNAAYGEYLAWHASGCAECHSPRDPRTAALDPTRLLAGSLFPFPEEGFITTGSNLTPEVTTGIGGWTEEQFVDAVQKGARPNGTVLVPFMPWPAYARWSRDDLHAVWLYLRSLPPIVHAIPATRLAPAEQGATGVQRGQAVYRAYCVTCHGKNGAGSPFTSDPLRHAARDLDDGTIAAFVAQGVPGSAMPAFDQTVTPDQIRDVTAFIRSWEKPTM